jgi:hypothetical protein
MQDHTYVVNVDGVIVRDEEYTIGRNCLYEFADTG